MMKLIQKVLLLMTFVVSYVACGNDDTPPKPEPNNTEYTLTYISTNIAELKQINNGDEVANINNLEIDTYFGKRMQYVTPKELQFRDNSVTIVLNSDIKRDYEFKWVDEELHIRCESSDDWEYCANKSDDNLIFNIALFNQSHETKDRTLNIIGQCNFLKSYSELLDSNELMRESSVVWLRADAIFQ